MNCQESAYKKENTFCFLRTGRRTRRRGGGGGGSRISLTCLFFLVAKTGEIWASLGACLSIASDVQKISARIFQTSAPEVARVCTHRASLFRPGKW